MINDKYSEHHNSSDNNEVSMSSIPPNFAVTQRNTFVTENYTSYEYDTYNDRVPLKLKSGDFTPFYISIAICTVILGSIIILNIICCCSRYSEYWLDRHTGNRWLVSIWSATPHKQPPLDLTELTVQYEPVYVAHRPRASSPHSLPGDPYDFPGSLSQQPLHTSQEHLELHKRESDL